MSEIVLVTLFEDYKYNVRKEKYNFCEQVKDYARKHSKSKNYHSIQNHIEKHISSLARFIAESTN
jgi:hypothetical protein